MSDKQRQEDEVEALQSIYDEDLWIKSRWPSSGCLSISPDPPTEDFSMNIKSVLNGQSIERNIKLRYLAPIELYFTCPDDYPSTSPPLFMLKCMWLPEQSLSEICRTFDSIWERNRSEILFDWACCLKDCCSILNIEHLSFNTNVFDESKIARLSGSELLESTTDLKLKELRNKSLENRDRNESPSKERLRRRRFHRAKLKDNFKYETPKDMETSAERIIPRFSEENTSKKFSYPAAEPLSKREFILTMLPRYGVRRKTLYCEHDSRVVPNYEQRSEDELGFCGSSYIVRKMIDFNDECVTRAFRHESHYCGICLEEKSGSVCVRVQLCGHIFCRDCISQYLRVLINDGNLRSLVCPNTDCGSPFTATQIRQCVDETTYKKFEKFKVKITVEDDPNLLYCPRNVCQSVARRCPELGRELCYCPRCSFYFCIYCKRAYHGVEPCQLQNEERIRVINEYLNADEVRREELEKKFSKQLIRKWVDEHLSKEWIQTSSKPCPNCGVPIQKNSGCNKMTCTSCNVSFCWLCDTCLSSLRPYDHFSDRKSLCYEKLFEMEEEAELEEDLFEDEEEFFDEEDDHVLVQEAILAAIHH